MENFIYKNPTKIIFGQGQIAQLTNEIPADKKILFLYGGGSIKKNGVYEQVTAALAQHQFVEFPGVEANPTYEKCMQAAKVCEQQAIDFILAVGGGSVIDASKFIAAAACFEGNDPWAILADNTPITNALPIGAVSTLPATGSETNGNSVITRKSNQHKRAFASPIVRPEFAIVDPAITFSLPERQIKNGIVDAFTHVMEQYLTYPADAPLQDRFAEGILLTLIEIAPTTLKEPNNYQARANLVWSALMALNGLIAQGVPEDWTTHMIGHQLTALYGLDHAVTLAIVLPGVMNVRRKQKREKLLQYAERIWGITRGDDDTRIDLAIAKTREFFENVGISTRLSAYDIGEEVIQAALKLLQEQGLTALGEHQDFSIEESERVLAEAL